MPYRLVIDLDRLLDVPVQRPPSHVLSHDVVRPLAHVELLELDDVRVAQRLHYLHLLVDVLHLLLLRLLVPPASLDLLARERLIVQKALN